MLLGININSTGIDDGIFKQVQIQDNLFLSCDTGVFIDDTDTKVTFIQPIVTNNHFHLCTADLDNFDDVKNQSDFVKSNVLTGAVSDPLLLNYTDVTKYDRTYHIDDTSPMFGSGSQMFGNNKGLISGAEELTLGGGLFLNPLTTHGF